MARPRQWPPKVHPHKGCSRVSWGGQWYHLGLTGSKDASAAYRRLIAAWEVDPYYVPDGSDELSVAKLCRDYLAAAPFPPGGLLQYRRAVGLLCEYYGMVPVEDFGPVMLGAWQRALAKRVVDEGRRKGKPLMLSRPYIGTLTRIVVGIWKWGVRTERLEPKFWHALQTVGGLRANEARDGRKVSAVDDRDFAVAVVELPRAARGLVCLVRLTGARPSELYGLKPADVVKAGDMWEFRPAKHKTTAHGKERVIYFGRLAKALLERYQPADDSLPYFVHDKGSTYNRHSLGWAVRRTCERAKVKRWTVYQCRHARLTEVRDAVGIEGAAAVGGHTRLSTTEIYSRARNDLAAKVAAESG